MAKVGGGGVPGMGVEYTKASHFWGEVLPPPPPPDETLKGIYGSL